MTPEKGPGFPIKLQCMMMYDAKMGTADEMAHPVGGSIAIHADRKCRVSQHGLQLARKGIPRRMIPVYTIYSSTQYMYSTEATTCDLDLHDVLVHYMYSSSSAPLPYITMYEYYITHVYICS